MDFPKRLSLNDAIHRLVIDREGYIPPRQMDTSAGPLLEVLDVLEERFETLICRDHTAREKLQRDLDAIENARNLEKTLRGEILDNARYLSDGDAGIKQLLEDPHLPYLSGEELLRWAARPGMGIRINGQDDFYRRLASETEESPREDADTGRVQPATRGTPPTTWDGVTLELRAANKLRVIAGDYKQTYELEGTEFVAKRNKQLTQPAALLLKVAAEGAVPNPKPTEDAPARLRTVMSKLRSALRRLTGIDQDPFMEFSKADGWIARFKLKDRRKAADERAREKAPRFSYDDNRDSPTSAADNTPFDREVDED